MITRTRIHLAIAAIIIVATIILWATGIYP